MRYRLIVATLLPMLAAFLVGWAWHLLHAPPDWTFRYLIEPLESRYQRPSAISEEDFTGIIALGGTNYPSRFAEAGRLARLYPELKVLISDQTDVAGALVKLGGGIDPSRIIVETKSKSTYQNAIFCALLVHPKPRERWLLVTSVLHMPRAAASFREAGFEVVAWPVYDEVSQASMVSPALHEWLGLVAYRLLGRTAELLPRK
jgi:uncharacterized SAM-binding protein YcdF (DUF218 family)